VISRRQIWGLVALTLMWGINWPIMKYSLRELSPLYLRALTMSFGAMWLVSYYRFKGVRIWPQATEWRSVVTLGLPNMLGWHTLSILGVKELASGRAAILGFTMPIWTVLLGVLLFKEKLTRRLVFAMAAVALTLGLLTFNELTALSGRPLGIVWMELAALCWAAGTLMMRRAHLTIPMETLTVWMMTLASACLWVLAAALEPWASWQFSGPMWVSLVYGALINYGFAQVIWFGMARHLPPSTSAMSVMAVPMVGTLSATLIVQEVPGWQDLVAALCVMGAIAAVLLPPRQTAKTV
jgi:drug/metabolite transporter (DMT)-like permease